MNRKTLKSLASEDGQPLVTQMTVPAYEDGQQDKQAPWRCPETILELHHSTAHKLDLFSIFSENPT